MSDFLLSLVALLTFILAFLFASPNTYPQGLAGQLFCYIIRSKFAIYMLNAVSVATIAAISIERYIAVLRPLNYKKVCTVARIKWVIVAIWLMQPILTSDYILSVSFHSSKNKTNKKVARCLLAKYHYLPQSNHFPRVNHLLLAVTLTLSMIRFLLPLLITTYSYLKIGQNSHLHNEALYHRHRTYSSTSIAIRRLTRMASVATVILLLCWIPREIYILLSRVIAISHSQIVDNITTTLVLLKCCLNPFLYAITNKTYRRAVLRLILKRLYRRENHHRPATVHISERNIFQTSTSLDQSKGIISNSTTLSTLAGSVISGGNHLDINTLPTGLRRCAWVAH
ncbi:Growth hormone secretagogue receptor type 1 [Trichoplax sp. H2]|nr:Growth hormone secretagogue receptor type 1 [Trichoplax sp. H2]|eukprot:RDD42186.1 Growth hormone secretagogue receptor type 1 [Trichoplax sp. H2]